MFRKTLPIREFLLGMVSLLLSAAIAAGGHGNPNPLAFDVAENGNLAESAGNNGMADGQGYAGCYDPDCTCPGNFWIVGAEATALYVSFAEGADTNIGPDGESVSKELADLQDAYVGPRVWLGIQGENLGIVARYWQLNGSEHYFDPIFHGGPASGFTSSVSVQQEFESYATDLEGLYRTSLCDLRFEFSGGARHASLERDSQLWASTVINGDFVNGTVVEVQEFNGTGITTAWGVSYPVFFSQSCVVFWNLRSSVLWGEIRNAVQSQASVVSVLGTGISSDGDANATNSEMFIGETQLGVQWNYQSRWVPARAFVRIAGEYQFWSADGAHVNSLATSGIPGNSEIIGAGSIDDLRLSLFGLTVGTGLTW